MLRPLHRTFCGRLPFRCSTCGSGAPASHRPPNVRTAATNNVGWVRLAHLSPNTPAVDVYLYPYGRQHP